MFPPPLECSIHCVGFEKLSSLNNRNAIASLGKRRLIFQKINIKLMRVDLVMHGLYQFYGADEDLLAKVLNSIAS